MKKLVFLAFLGIIITSSPLTGKGPITIDDTLIYKNISEYIEYIEDKDHNLSIENVAKGDRSWETSKRRKVNLGWTNSCYWYRFTIKSSISKCKDFFLEIDNPLIDFAELYIPKGQGAFDKKMSGDAVTADEKEIIGRTILFSITSSNREQTYFLRVKTSGTHRFTLSALSHKGHTDRKDKELPLYFIFYGLILTLILYSAVIYFFSKQRAYIYYALFLFFAFLWHFNDSGFTSLYFWQNSPWLQNHSLVFCIPLVYFWLVLFFNSLIEMKEKFPVNYKIIVYTLQIPSVFLALLSLFWDYTIIMKSLYAFQLYVVISLTISGLYDAFIGKSRQARLLIIAFMPVAFAIPVFLLSNMGVLPMNLFFKWVPAIGISITFFILSMALADKINSMSITIIKAEKKYRNLVESSNDVIFSLDTDYNILSMNKSFEKHLGFKMNDVIGKNFLDFIQQRAQFEGRFVRDIIGEYMAELEESKQDVNFKIDFKTAFADEPIELSVKLEYVEGESGDGQILGKASVLTDDIIVQYLKEEKHNYEVKNYLNLAELLSQRLTRNLVNTIKVSEMAVLRVALREIIINAIEHGNLDIQFSEKTQALTSGSYLKYIQERQKDPKYMHKKVTIDYFFNRNKVQYRITDQGQGFDHQNIENIIDSKTGEAGEALQHGRGIMIAKEYFDELKYNEKGNSVVLVKYFN